MWFELWFEPVQTKVPVVWTLAKHSQNTKLIAVFGQFTKHLTYIHHNMPLFVFDSSFYLHDLYSSMMSYLWKTVVNAMYFEEYQTTVVWVHEADVVWTVVWARVGAKRSNVVWTYQNLVI